MEDLPEELAVDIASRVGGQAVHPMEDLSSLRASCRVMRRACLDPQVGRSIRLQRVLERPAHVWSQVLYYDQEYRSRLISNLAVAGNAEACFLRGLSVAFGEDRGLLSPRVDMLHRASNAGHRLASFLLALLLYRSNSGTVNDRLALELMSQIENDEGRRIEQVWMDKVSTDYGFEIHHMLWCSPVPVGSGAMPGSDPRVDGRTCAGGWCSEYAGITRRGYEWSLYCSEECRINSVCHKFFRSFW